MTPSFTRTSTPTVTNTAVNTATRTATITLTPTITPSVQEIKDLKPWPNPVNPGTGTAAVDFTINQADPDKIGMRIFSVSFRLVRDIYLEGAEAQSAARNGRLTYNSCAISGLSNGMYYYYIYAVKDNKETKSTADKLMIIR